MQGSSKGSLWVVEKWEFPKIGDPNILPQIVGSLLRGSQNEVPLIFGNSQIYMVPLRLGFYGSRSAGLVYEVQGPDIRL